jgi:hypothetical protein
MIFFFFVVNFYIAAQNKFALVIGNGNYTSIEKLGNPVNDATDIASKLRSLGYQVELKTNVGNAEMGRSVNDYIQRLAQNRNNEGFFWFAGHGVQIDGENYLLPVFIDRFIAPYMCFNISFRPISAVMIPVLRQPVFCDYF